MMLMMGRITNEVFRENKKIYNKVQMRSYNNLRFFLKKRNTRKNKCARFRLNGHTDRLKLSGLLNREPFRLKN